MRANTGGAGGSSSGNITPSYIEPPSLHRRSYSYAFTGDTGLLGPLSLAALLSGTRYYGEEDGSTLATATGLGRGKGPSLGHHSDNINKQGQGQGRSLRETALGMLKEYVNLGGPGPREALGRGGRIRHMDVGEGDADADADGEEEVLLAAAAAGEEEGRSGGSGMSARGPPGDGEQFWVEYFRMLGFVEVLTPGAEHFMHDYGLVQ